MNIMYRYVCESACFQRHLHNMKVFVKHLNFTLKTMMITQISLAGAQYIINTIYIQSIFITPTYFTVYSSWLSKCMTRFVIIFITDACVSSISFHEMKNFIMQYLANTKIFYNEKLYSQLWYDMFIFIHRLFRYF